MEKIIKVDADYHLVDTSKIVDHQANKASCRIDARRDRNWFQRHPDIDERVRPISGRERRAFGICKSEKVDVLVIRLEDGMQARAVIEVVEERSADGNQPV